MITFTTENNKPIFTDHWMANGYIAVPKGHAVYGKNYFDLDTQLYNMWMYVHWWLTFWEHISEAPDHIVNGYINAWGSAEDDVFIYWFDTMHYWDKKTEWTVENVARHALEIWNVMSTIK